MGCGASAGAPVLLAELRSRYADVVITDQNAVIVAKRYLDTVKTVRYDDTFSSKPKMVEEDVVMVDNSRIGVYKGDTVNIDTAGKMRDVAQYNTLCNGVELHIVLNPLHDLPERIVVSSDPSTRQFCVRHDDPLEVAESKAFVRLVTPETSVGGSSVSSLPGTPLSTPKELTGWRLWEPEPVNVDIPSPEQLEKARVYRRLSEELQALEVESVTSSTVATPCGPPSALENPTPNTRHRHSIAGPEELPQKSPARQRRHSVSGVQSLDAKLEQDAGQARLQKQLTSVLESQGDALQKMNLCGHVKQPSRSQRRHSVPTLDAQPCESSIHQRRRHSVAHAESLPCIDSPQPLKGRRHSVAHTETLPCIDPPQSPPLRVRFAAELCETVSPRRPTSARPSHTEKLRLAETQLLKAAPEATPQRQRRRSIG